ncbi:MAG: transposon-transfer assisting family protein [Oscillospiraceae bacterium]|jgi:hypothetical protein|nr:transposon-transfer assisting family protein [Oscillospiraceae bacterium]
MPEQFTVEEINMMCIFDTSGRDALISELTAFLPELDEPGLSEIAESVIAKLGKMSGAEFAALKLCPAYDDYDEESEVKPNGD